MKYQILISFVRLHKFYNINCNSNLSNSNIRLLPVGGELEHVDSGTLAQAVLERRVI